MTLTLVFSILVLFYLLVFFLFIIKNDPLILAFSILFYYFDFILFLFIQNKNKSNTSVLYTFSILFTKTLLCVLHRLTKTCHSIYI